ncbi:MAG: hypothetical protein FLDDKLPJ_01584 [Phycisphaerae bacterium]|nr:hypothetical protein [Phycisphaerae bacterium]
MKLGLVTYADTSVYGGVFDEEFSEASRSFFNLAGGGRFRLLVSDVLRREIERAPDHVRGFFDQQLHLMTFVAFTREVMALRDAYLKAGILGVKSADDAAHVASAVVGGADLIVSWNFRHIVHIDKARMYNAVNQLHGYRAVEIRSPAEVIEYEDEDV